MGDGGELERTRAGWRVKRYDHVAKNKLRQNFAKVAKILLLSQKYSRTNPAKLLKTFSTSFCVCLDSWKQRNLEIRANIPKSCRKLAVCDKIGLYCSEFMLGMRTCLPSHIPDRWSRYANRICPDLAFGLVHKRSGNEITLIQQKKHLFVQRSWGITTSSKQTHSFYVRKEIKTLVILRMLFAYMSPESIRTHWPDLY